MDHVAAVVHQHRRLRRDQALGDGREHQHREQGPAAPGCGMAQPTGQRKHAHQRAAEQQPVVRGQPPNRVAQQVDRVAHQVEQRVERPPFRQRHHRPHAVGLGVERVGQRPAARDQVERHKARSDKREHDQWTPPAAHEPPGAGVTRTAEQPRDGQDGGGHERLWPCPPRQPRPQPPQRSRTIGAVQGSHVRQHGQCCERSVERHLHPRQACPRHAWRDGHG